MSLIRPFAALRPTPEHATDVVAPPYDVLNVEEARQRADGRPWSFLHISRPEIDLPEGTDPYDPSVYAKGAENLARMIDAGVLTRDPEAYYYVYRLTMGTHVQTGLVAVASVPDYDINRIRKHEFTRPVKEDDRVRQIEALQAQTGPVFLVYPEAPTIDAVLARTAEGIPEYDVTADDGVRHQIWVLRDAEAIATITTGFDAMNAIYIADGHHRSAAASRVYHATCSDSEECHSGNESSAYFLSVVFPHHEMKILDYNRVITDLHGLDAETFLARVAERFDVELVDSACKPSGHAEFGMYLDGRWYRLTLHAEHIPSDDPVARLDVSLLQDNLIDPILAIEDPRRDKRIDFVGGIRGLKELEKRVDSGAMAVAFALYPTSMEALMAVADANEVMPPKSTWFEPKLADGLLSHMLD
ncbi:MAG: DUF1015 domain-containing protein [Gammaproteobacteria bacterium]|nr:DUF1015 domain-containing protein [Gammaproteobacteria bacterium]MCP5135245.1 DUF1015 domain-containing protein [Gammaproteobacteria bacterium]